MILNKKTFQRRPWSPDSHGLVQHFDDISVENVELKGMYLAMHTDVTFLKSNDIDCTLSSDSGFYWPKLVIENFTIDNVRNGEGIFICDGTVKDLFFTLILRNGKITNLSNSHAICLDHLQLELCQLENLVLNDQIKIENCTINLLKITNTPNAKIYINDSTIKRIELWNSPNYSTIGDPISSDIVHIFEAKVRDDLKIAMAANVMIDGVIYSASCNSTILEPKG